MKAWKSDSILTRTITGRASHSTKNGRFFFLVEKVFKTLDEQLDRLESRGVIISDRQRVKNYLLTNNYYNIINGYSKPFLKQKEKYFDGTNFDEIKYLYFFDEEMKRLLFNSILLAEHHIKSIFSYRFAECFSDQRYAYLDIHSYDPQKVLKVGRLISQLSNILKKNDCHKGNAINYYIHKYHEVPIWVLVDFIDFGQLCSLLDNVNPVLKNKIALDLTSFIESNIENVSDRFAPEIMLSLVQNIREVRNICAHNKRLLYYECREDSLYFPPLDKKYNIKNTDQRRNIYTTFLSLQCFLSEIEFAELNNSIRKRMNKVLIKHISTIDMNDIIRLYGFPNDWSKMTPLR